MRVMGKAASLCLVILAIICLQSAGAAAKNAEVIAVLPFENSSGLEKLEPLEEGLRDLIIADLSKVKGITVVERGSLEKIIKEQKLSLRGFMDKKTQVEVGKLIGANIMLTGGFTLADSKLKINGHLLDVETTRLIKSEEVSGEVRNIIGLERELVLKLVRGLDLKMNSLGMGEIDTAPQVNLHFIRGLGYYYGSMYDQAIMEFMNTLKLKPSHADARFWMGRSYLEEKEYDHARVEFDRFLRELPKSSLAPQTRAFLRQCGKQSWIGSK